MGMALGAVGTKAVLLAGYGGNLFLALKNSYAAVGKQGASPRTEELADS